MKLDHECVRAFLLEYEDKGPAYKYETLNDLQNLNCYHTFGPDVLAYTIAKLIEAGFVTGEVKWDWRSGQLEDCHIFSMTYSGHEFLDTIRDNKVWASTKKAISAFSSVALSTVMGVGKSLTLKMIADKTGIQII